MPPFPSPNISNKEIRQVAWQRNVLETTKEMPRDLQEATTIVFWVGGAVDRIFPELTFPNILLPTPSDWVSEVTIMANQTE